MNFLNAVFAQNMAQRKYKNNLKLHYRNIVKTSKIFFNLYPVFPVSKVLKAGLNLWDVLRHFLCKLRNKDFQT